MAEYCNLTTISNPISNPLTVPIRSPTVPHLLYHYSSYRNPSTVPPRVHNLLGRLQGGIDALRLGIQNVHYHSL